MTQIHMGLDTEAHAPYHCPNLALWAVLAVELNRAFTRLR